MLINNYTPAEPCSSKIPENSKIIFAFNEQYFIKLYFDVKVKNIFISC